MNDLFDSNYNPGAETSEEVTECACPIKCTDCVFYTILKNAFALWSYVSDYVRKCVVQFSPIK